MADAEPGPGALRELAARAGILEWYVDHAGTWRRTLDSTRRALLEAMGYDAAGDDGPRASLEALREADDNRLLAPVRVVEIGSPDISRLDARPPASCPPGIWRVEIATEEGDRHVVEDKWPGAGAIEPRLPHDLPLGYHRVSLALSAGGREWCNDQTLIIAPARCVIPDQILDGRGAFGLIANLYTIRSRTNWGAGDFGDLSTLAAWTGSVGGDFVGVNPLHTLLNRGDDVSPYSPVSRLFRNPLYVDVTRVPELAHATGVCTRLATPEFKAELDALRADPAVRYEQVMAVKGMALDALHHVFTERVLGSLGERDLAYRAYVTAREPALTRFATWMTIAELEHSGDWRTWPSELQAPDSAAVERIAEAHAKRIDFHRWVQFEADRQLGQAAACARDAGLRIGLYQDLAIGSSPAGADTWAHAGLFVRGASIGAPPDPYSANGQNWGLPPIDPRALKQDRYRYFINLIRNGFEHSGALRIDHVMGLFRLFWVADGTSARDGAYVRYPAEDLLGIVALESVRNNALVVGEDLGTVPDEVPPRLAKWGILSSRVLYFERDWHGGFKPADRYPPLSLATANTHDMPTLAGFWSEHDITVRRATGLIANDDEERHAREERARDREALLQLLQDERILVGSPHSSAELRAAVHGFLWSTPARLVGLALDDVAGETEAVNVPGVSQDRHASWTRKMRADLESVTTSDEADVILARTRRP